MGKFLISLFLIVFFVILFVLLFSGFIEGDVPVGAIKCETRNQNCFQIYQPVCGSNSLLSKNPFNIRGKGYRNGCEACANPLVDYYFEGRCSQN